MYTSNSTQRYEIPTSDIERSRRYGAGIYPDYSRGYPTQSNILTASASPEQRIQPHSRQASSSSRDFIAANITTMTGTELPSSSITAQPLVPYTLNLGGIFSNLSTQDPFKAFILEPFEPSTQDAIYNAIACKDLPLSVREKELNWKSVQVRNLLGIISQDVRPEDQPLLKKCFAMLKKVQYNVDIEPELGKNINSLLHKYGQVALYRHVDNYTECCRKVWHYYHPGHTTRPKDDEIFTPDAELCYRVIFSTINRLIQTDKIWIETVANGVFFKDSCRALAVSIKYDSKIKIPPESITETFDSVYLTRETASANINNQHGYEIENAECYNDTLTTWERTMNILCCDSGVV